MTDAQLWRLAARQVISTQDLESVALQFLGIEYSTVRTLRHQCIGNPGEFGMEILVEWRNKNSGGDQLPVRGPMKKAF